MYKVTQVEVLENYRVALTFDDGTSGVADLSNLAGKGVFAFWLDYDAFRKVRIGPVGELAWDGEVDLCPDALYLRVTGKKPEDLFPALRREPAHARD